MKIFRNSDANENDEQDLSAQNRDRSQAGQGCLGQSAARTEA
jgi:hypothetical protein